MEAKNLLQALAARWPATYVPRERIGEFSGHIISPKTCANLDSTGRGIEGRVRINNKICYPVANVIAFLESKVQVQGEK